MQDKINIDCFTQFHHYRFEEGYQFEGHSHASWEINIILNGQMSITYSDKVILLSKGDFFIGNPWVFHCNKAIGNDAEMSVIQFLAKEKVVGQDFSARALSEEEFAMARLLVTEMEKYCRCLPKGRIPDGEQPWFTDCRKMCEVLLSRVHGTENDVRENRSNRARLYKDVIQYMNAHIDEKLTIDKISRQMHVSQAYLKNVFLEFTGGGIMNYFTEIKINKAKRLLEQGENISFVSDTLGFSSQSYFSTVFGKVTGTTPKRYQKIYGSSSIISK